MNRNRLVLITLATAALLIMVFITGCIFDPMSYEGTPKVKSAPHLFWANTYVATQNSRNPVLSWYSTDADGKVLDYHFIVLPESTVQRLDPTGGAAGVAAHFPAGFQWTVVHEDSATVPLYANPDPDSAVAQCVFLKAMDDDSLYSAVIYKLLSRTNHPPTCYLDLPKTGNASSPRPDPQWCLPETTSTWKGIRVAWVGKDSIDIPGLQPDFQWNIRLYGPFADSISSDTLRAHLYREFTDSTGGIWIWDKEMKLKDLETGWFAVYARNRDDAFVPSVPAIGYLVIFEPTWIRHPELTKKILLADHTGYRASYHAELPESLSTAMIDFYKALCLSAGYDSTQVDYIDFTQTGNNEVEPQKADLYNHELVIVVDTDWAFPFKFDPGRDQHAAYAKYLDVGGMMWVVGRRTFQDLGEIGLVPFALNDPDRTLPNGYFNLSGAFGQSTRIPTQAEFAGATGVAEGFPNIMVDTIRVAQTSNASYQYSQGLFGVSYLIRKNSSETIYKFNSLYPDTSRFHNFPVAVRYEVPGSFKTSIFSFPLYFIQTDQAEIITRNMLNWFFEN